MKKQQNTRPPILIGSRSAALHRTGKFAGDSVPTFLDNLDKFEKDSRKSRFTVG